MVKLFSFVFIFLIGSAYADECIKLPADNELAYGQLGANTLEVDLMSGSQFMRYQVTYLATRQCGSAIGLNLITFATNTPNVVCVGDQIVLGDEHSGNPVGRCLIQKIDPISGH